MSTIRVCGFCQKPLPSNRKRFCSPKCLAEGLKSKPIECSICHTEFRPIRKSQKFCGLDCFNKSRILRSRQTPEPPRVKGAMWVSLTQGKFALVDKADFPEVSRYNWCAVKVRPNDSGDVFYAKRTDSPIYLHRFLVNPPEGMEVDHIGDTLDCRRSMLRAVSRSSNQMNRYSNGGTSRFKGVTKSKGSKNWTARVDADGIIHHLGQFDDEENAARAYDVAARVYQGPQARLNFPLPGERSAIREVKS